MIRGRSPLFGLFVLGGIVLAAPAAAEFTYNGLIDLRLVSQPGETSWTKGGLGKLRYGGGGLKPDVALAAVDASWQLTPALGLNGTVRFQPSAHDTVDVTTAYALWQPVTTATLDWSIKGGAFFPPISLENDGVGWSSHWTLTPSAINSWVGDELRTIGAETELVWRSPVGRLSAGGALYAANDPAGLLLADRGWTLGDLTTGLGGSLREPDALAVLRRLGKPIRFRPFEEVDGRPGWYAGIAWHPIAGSRIQLLRYDNEADPTARTDITAWHTRFWSLGAKVQVGDVVLQGQALTGDTEVAPSPTLPLRTSYQAADLLVGVGWGAWRPAVRVDLFCTNSHAASVQTLLSERGSAVTVALGYRLAPQVRLMGEVLRVDSDRGQRRLVGRPARSVDTQAQMSLRLFF